ncbi:hypothetical protein HanRHA438_Chr02g0049531 [Helianthus annuus]|nr:hypothetical protein HanIR_Chr02g0054041 [Helianthus annuus]KAJ0938406.1 hypothetical protein HanRHA438_Chr02g0049531 [Helianthus annuus]
MVRVRDSVRCRVRHTTPIVVWVHVGQFYSRSNKSVWFGQNQQLLVSGSVNWSTRVNTDQQKSRMVNWS